MDLYGSIYKKNKHNKKDKKLKSKYNQLIKIYILKYKIYVMIVIFKFY